MRRSTVTITLIALWLFSFLLCLLVPLYFKRDIPTNFTNLLKEVFDTFSPSLAAMLAFTFAKHTVVDDLKAAAQDSIVTNALALLLSVVYLGIFDGIMFMFASGRLRADETVELFQTYRPYTGFLVIGMIAYYFGSEPKIPRPSPGTTPTGAGNDSQNR